MNGSGASGGLRVCAAKRALAYIWPLAEDWAHCGPVVASDASFSGKPAGIPWVTIPGLRSAILPGLTLT